METISPRCFYPFGNWASVMDEFDKRRFSPLPTDDKSEMMEYGISLMRAQATTMQKIKERKQQGKKLTVGKSRAFPAQEVIQMAINISELEKLLRMINKEIQRFNAAL